MMRSLAVQTCCCALLCLSTGCNETQPDGQIYSETHFLTDCESDNDCGALSCICDVCTNPCSADLACQELSSAAVCAEFPSQIECSTGAPAGDVCLELCSEDIDCGPSGVCRSGLCRQGSGSVEADPEDDATDRPDLPDVVTDPSDLPDTVDAPLEDGSEEVDGDIATTASLGPIPPVGWLCGLPTVVVEFPNSDCPACNEVIMVGTEQVWWRAVRDVGGHEYDNGLIEESLFRAFESALGPISPDEMAAEYGEQSLGVDPVRLGLIGATGDVTTAVHDRDALPETLANLLDSLDAIHGALPARGDTDVGLPPLTPPVDLDSSCEDPFEIEVPVLSIDGPDGFVFEPGAAGFADEDLPADLVITGSPSDDGTVADIVVVDDSDGVWTIAVAPLPESEAGITLFAERRITVTARLSGSAGNYATSMSISGERGILFVMDSGLAGIGDLERSFVSIGNAGCGRREVCEEGTPSGAGFTVTSETYFVESVSPGEWLEVQLNSGRGLRLLNTSPTAEICDPTQASYVGWGVLGSDRCGVRLRLNSVGGDPVLDISSAPDKETWHFVCGEVDGCTPEVFGWERMSDDGTIESVSSPSREAASATPGPNRYFNLDSIGLSEAPTGRVRAVGLVADDCEGAPCETDSEVRSAWIDSQ